MSKDEIWARMDMLQDRVGYLEGLAQPKGKGKSTEIVDVEDDDEEIAASKSKSWSEERRSPTQR